RTLEARYDRNPTDVQTLQALVRLTDDAQKRAAYLAQAREAGVDANVLTVLERQLSDNPMTAEEMLRMLGESGSDPAVLAMAEARRLAGEGKLDEAEKKLAELATMKPDDPSLVELRFRLALQREDWDLAERLAATGRDLN